MRGEGSQVGMRGGMVLEIRACLARYLVGERSRKAREVDLERGEDDRKKNVERSLRNCGVASPAPH